MLELCSSGYLVMSEGKQYSRFVSRSPVFSLLSQHVLS